MHYIVNLLWSLIKNDKEFNCCYFVYILQVYDTAPEAWVSQYEYIGKNEGRPRTEQQESAMVNGENEENVEPRPGPSRGGRRK